TRSKPSREPAFTSRAPELARPWARAPLSSWAPGRSPEERRASAHEAEHRVEPSRAPGELLELTVVEIDAAAVEALVDLHPAEFDLLKLLATLGASHPVDLLEM